MTEATSQSERAQKEREATNQLDGHLEAAPRVAGSFAGCYRASTLAGLEAGMASAKPIVATIDLDYFSGLEPNELSIEFEWVWKFVTERPNLRAITIAISRSHLTDDAEADARLTLALRAALSLPTARIEFGRIEPSVMTSRSARGKDSSTCRYGVPRGIE